MSLGLRGRRRFALILKLRDRRSLQLSLRLLLRDRRWRAPTENSPPKNSLLKLRLWWRGRRFHNLNAEPFRPLLAPFSFRLLLNGWLLNLRRLYC